MHLTALLAAWAATVAGLRPVVSRVPRRACVAMSESSPRPGGRKRLWSGGRPFAGLFKREQLLADWGLLQRSAPSARAARLDDRPNETLSLDERAALADPGAVDRDWVALRASLAHLAGDAAGLDTVRDALRVAHGAHAGQVRRSGEPFIVHPVAVAGLLASLRMDADTVAAGLLHDTVEDTAVTLEALEARYGADVRAIVEGETKVSKLPKLARPEDGDVFSKRRCFERKRDRGTTKELEQLENLRQMFVAMTDDYRIIIVKLADRLHNMRTLEHMPPQKQYAIARETLEIFAPLAHRLGLWQFKSELEDTAFRFAQPDAYDALRRALDARAETHDAALGGARAALEARLGADDRLRGVAVSVTGRTKELYSLWRKLERQRAASGGGGERAANGRTAEFAPADLDAVEDVVALRAVLDVPREDGESVEAWRERGTWLCYHALGLVQDLDGCAAVPRVKDYISFPKPNGYRSLHASVRREAEDRVVEIQIRTAWMHAVAEHGMAAHWLYKDGLGGLVEPVRDADAKPYAVAWLDSVKDWQHDIRSSREFVETIRREILGKRVFVFLRDGRILDMSRGATVLDAAFHIHTEVGLHCAKALINGREVQLGYELRNGDVVSIATSDDARPQLDWLRMAQRRSTRSKLRSYFKDAYRDYEAHLEAHKREFQQGSDA